ncbi:MAG: pitrilysin family protein [Candidatus Omnitrophota bacterium]
MYKIREYKNSVKLITKKMQGVSSVSLGFWFDTGSRNESPQINGISHFLEHLVFKGSKHYSGDKIKESIEGVGGSLNAFTSEENTCYYAKFLGKHFHNVFRVLSDMVLLPLLKAKDIEKERGVIIEEIKMYKDLPQYQVQELFDELLWPGHPLGRNIAGSIDSVSGISPARIRDYHAQWYSPANLVVSCAGDLNENDLQKNMERVFGPLKFSSAQPIIPFVSRRTTPTIKIISKDIEQTHVHLGFPSFHRSHKDRFVLSVLHVVLGGNMSSRLFNEVREKKGLAYEIASHVKKLKDTGVFFVHAGIDNRNLVQAARVIFKELDTLRRLRVSAGELRRAKDFLIAQTEMALDDTMEHMLWMGDGLLNCGLIETKEELRRHIERITSADCLRVARDVIRWPQLHFAAVGPQSHVHEKKIRDLVSRLA